jgi:predicted Zn-dependent protease
VQIRRSSAKARLEARRLLREGTPGECRAFTSAAVERFPKDAELRLDHATALLPFDAEKTRSEAVRGASSQPHDPVVLIRAARMLLASGDLDAARSWIERVPATRPSNPVIVTEFSYLRGEIAAAQGEYDTARNYLTSAHNADPAAAMISLILARVLLVLGESAEAMRVLDEALSMPVTGLYGEESHAKLRDLRSELAAALRREQLTFTTTPIGPRRGLRERGSAREWKWSASGGPTA